MLALYETHIHPTNARHLRQTAKKFTHTTILSVQLLQMGSTINRMKLLSLHKLSQAPLSPVIVVLDFDSRIRIAFVAIALSFELLEVDKYSYRQISVAEVRN